MNDASLIQQRSAWLEPERSDEQIRNQSGTHRDDRARQARCTGLRHVSGRSRATRFQVPIVLSISDFDDTEMVQAARSALHRTFSELASQSKKWKLTANDLKQLSSMSVAMILSAEKDTLERRRQ
jgi:hypothetical protein